MKSHIRRVSLLVGLVLVALVGNVVWAQGDDTPQQPVRAAVSATAPGVYVLEDGADSEKFVELTVFDAGETLRTDATGAALITWFYDGTETMLAQNSVLTLNAFEGTSGDDYAIDVALEQGHLVTGLGGIAADLATSGTLRIATPEFAVHLVRGHVEVSVAEGGASWAVVTIGQAVINVEGAAPVELNANEYYANGEKGMLSTDGVTPALSGVCTVTANTNLVVRMYPSENSQRLGGVPTGQVMWVRAGTEGNLWYQIGYETDPLQTDLYNYGWVYGPATTMDEAACGVIPRAALDAHLYGGLGADQAGALPETEPIETE